MTVEEVANVLTHGAGLVLSVLGFAVLLALSITYGDGWHLAASLVYGISLVTLYAASTLYHTVITPTRKRIFQLLDHSCIYLLIAGTYTPFLLIVLRDNRGGALLASVWGFAAVGIALKLIFRDRFDAIGIVLYLLMGWAGIVLIKPVYEGLGPLALALVVSGGITYEGRRVIPDVSEDVGEVASWITPRLGGVGPTTVAMLLRNTVTACIARSPRV